MTDSLNPKNPRMQTIADLTRHIVHKHYCENDVEALVEQLDDHFFWFGTAEHEFSVSAETTAQIFRGFAGKVPKCIIEDEQYHVLEITSEVYLCVGRMWISTDASTKAYLRVHQRITAVFRWIDEYPRCCHIHISNPYEDMRIEDIGFPHGIAHQSYQYLQEQITLYKKQIAEQAKLLEKMSYEDSLTGLYNRNKFNMLLSSGWIKDKKQMGLACFDLNGLKCVNDHCGHSSGDVLLSRVAEHLRRKFRSKAYRMGGDEFVVIDTEQSEADFRAAIQAVQTEMAEDGILCSVGICWRDTRCNIQEQYEEADQMMYQQKRLFYSSVEHDRRRPRD